MPRSDPPTARTAQKRSIMARRRRWRTSMPRRNQISRRTVTALLALVPFLAAPVRAEDASGPDTFVASIAQRGIVDILNANIGNAEKQQRFRTLFKQDFDIPAIGQFVLGRYSRTVSPDDKQHFSALFEDVIVYTW